MGDVTLAAHEATTRQSIHETTRQLTSHLGPTAVSYLAGAKSRKQSVRWADAEGPEPRPEAKRRLMAAHRVWQMILTAEGEDVARNWFVGANPRLDEGSPLDGLRDGDLAKVMAAARAFTDGTDG